MALAYNFSKVGVFLLFSLLIFRFGNLEAALVPALYVFGDSLVDVGNNNYLKTSLAKADFPHNGVDFPTKKPTGRFCNGKNAADFLAEKVGLPSSPPYLSLGLKSRSNRNATSFLTGVSFASGGAGIFNETDVLFRKTISLTPQVDYFTVVYQELVQQLGSSAAQAHLSKSLFAIVIGSNDIYGYAKSSDLRKKSAPQQYFDLMTLSLEAQLKRLYNYGARKFVIAGLGALGCTPSQRNKNKTHECNAEVNNWSVQYNEGLKSMLRKLKTEHNDINYSYFDTYAAMLTYIQSPSNGGFVEVKAACCGLGHLNAEVPCLPFASLCSNRGNHLFWDLYHPTQETHRIIAQYIFYGPSKYTYPLNVEKLIAI